MNKVALSGRLTKDIEVKRTTGDNPHSVTKFQLAVDRRVKKDGSADQQTADFIPCTAFDKTAEFLEKYGKKGRRFIVEGRIQTGNYTNKDGQKVYTTDVIVENVEFADSKPDGSGSKGGSKEPPDAPAPDDVSSAPENFYIPDDDDLPNIPF